MERFKEKLETIIDFDLKEIIESWSVNHIKNLERKYEIKLPKDYSFYLQHYGNAYIREGYCFIPSKDLSNNTKQAQFEIDSIYGLYNDENNIEDKINFYKELLPENLIPIADLPGGELVCIGTKDDKLNKIYFWFHEMDGENVYLVSDSFESFIMNFKKVDVEKNNLENVNLNISDKLNTFLNNASKK
ncbi:SMI1/KNR4 family protein [Aquisalibacillus elongatus]|uniref:SUKH superfamily protein n=1 Tax=Aquisalibacillus elongatus TaxID=485577 RepID=A0A3N5B9S7_9BACI|nr:SMI1/KNR4 family protein [Aquisalibacillus elongatus]RPF54153.1 SUKH superfamily protein [Aquisalibacillus elongatus]